ncbi:MerR family DNA-binding protein [Paucibacter sp. DJ1R-11]|uniref:MerR family DNA-binding protein n=1 Tax=Paucibacter sp. DJ1R-11 TaxID=2893556 RepID=UPI0021E46CAD|nr:MerR family DNA-binding protein [Paucibacter sp. DJ1R-11]MCV2362927.1 MerR family DNA-binding protein [Paucibacter sp. DJ1R-11]
MDIAEVAKRSGVAASALRYYERRGLIRSLDSQEEGESARRKFAPHVLDQLALVALGQSAGFSLDEIRDMLTSASPKGAQIDRSRLTAKADELDRSIKQLQAMSAGLRHAAACPAASHADCPSFQRLLKAAAGKALEKKQMQAKQRAPRPRGPGV